LNTKKEMTVRKLNVISIFVLSASIIVGLAASAALRNPVPIVLLALVGVIGI